MYGTRNGCCYGQFHNKATPTDRECVAPTHSENIREKDGTCFIGDSLLRNNQPVLNATLGEAHIWRIRTNNKVEPEQGP